jgi:DNA polymerase (family 10)
MQPPYHWPVNAPALSNADIAQRFELLASLLELEGAAVYRVLAYQRAAKNLRETPESIARLSAEGRLTELPGVGDTIADKVAELLETGRIAALDRVVARTPPGIVPLLSIPGVGPKTARRIFAELGLETVDDVRDAAQTGRIRGLAGLGEKTEAAILAGLAEEAAATQPRLLQARARALGERVVGDLRGHPAVAHCDVAGGLRRFSETVKDIDVVAAVTDPAAVGEALAAQDWAAAVNAGPSKITATAHDGSVVDLRMVPPGSFGNLLQHFTGSKHHNVDLREAAVRVGLKVSEYGIEVVENGERFASDDEAEVYGRLGLPWIPPELRENRGELEAAREGRLPELVELADIRGDLHTHTDWSDGKTTIERMVEAARARGYGYYAITDHSPAVGFGMGLDAARLRAQIERVRALAASLDGFTLLVGAEVDILRDGSLDYSDALLAELDVVVASVHSSFRLSEADQTKRLCAALEHPLVDILGHPTGRRIGRRDPIAIDVEAVVGKAAETGTALEVSGQPERLDLRDANVRLAVEAGVPLVVDTDAHSIAALDYMRFGVATARRGWATAAHIVNTRDWPEARSLLKRGRR